MLYFSKHFEKFEEYVEKFLLNDFIEKNDTVAIKLHVGEEGNRCFLDASFANTIARLVKNKGARCFFTDTSTYYKKKRHIAVDHVFLALEHGFTEVPFIQSDGIYEEGIKVKTKGILNEVYIAKLYEYVDKVIVLTHPTGHRLTGFGGAIKNIGMGTATKKGKLITHRVVDLVVDYEKCTGCKICVEKCPYGAAVVENGKRRPELDKETCMRCPVCMEACPQKAIKLVNLENLCRALASVCYAFLKLVGKENVRYVSVAKNISNRCDCSTMSEVIEEDVGFFMSDDLVAIDSATLEKIKTDFFALHGVNPWVQIEEAERLGLGKREEVTEI